MQVETAHSQMQLMFTCTTVNACVHTFKFSMHTNALFTYMLSNMNLTTEPYENCYYVSKGNMLL